MSLLDRLEKQKFSSTDKSAEITLFDEYSDLKEQVHKGFIEAVNQQDISLFGVKGEQEDELLKIMDSLIESKAPKISRTERSKLLKEIFNDVMGLGPLEVLLNDDDITEIMVNGPSQVYVERKGKLELSNVVFKDKTHVMNIINRIVSTVGRRIDESSPMVDARLKDGSRFNAVIPPLSLVGPSMTIRKFSKKPFTASDLIKFGSLSPKMVAFLEACVKGRMNIIVSGGTGSGKTTFMKLVMGLLRPTKGSIIKHFKTFNYLPELLIIKSNVLVKDYLTRSLRLRNLKRNFL